jgi:peptidoglycan/LPS O-acetylase OafA/YrhL
MDLLRDRTALPALTIDSSRRILELDGVRGIACLTVLIWHYFIATVELGGTSIAVHMGGWSILGPSGVDLFFVLSGFLISGILFDNRNSPNYFKTFYVRRICRIFPVYYVMVLSFILVRSMVSPDSAFYLWLLKDPMPTAAYATFTQNFAMACTQPATAGAKWMAMSWSVAVEEQFYMLFPLVVWLVPMLRLRHLILLAIPAAPVLRVLAGHCGLWYYTLLPCRVDGLAVGVAAAYLVRQPFILSWMRDNRTVLYLGMVICALGFCFFRADYLGYTWIALFYGLCILLVVVHPDTIMGTVCRWPFLRWLGLISYGLYMYHQTVNGVFHAVFMEQAPAIRNLRGFGLTLVSAATCLAIASVSFYGMEKWLLKLGQKSKWFPKVDAGASTASPAMAKAA